MSNVLVVYYSRIGGTRQVAQTLADALGRSPAGISSPPWANIGSILATSR